MFSTLAYDNKKEKKGNPPNHYLDKQTNIYSKGHLDAAFRTGAVDSSSFMFHDPVNAHHVALYMYSCRSEM